MYGIVNKPVVTVYRGAYTEETTREGKRVSAITDEGLYGMIFAVNGKAEGGFVPVRTFYGYTGYVKARELLWMGEQEAKAWEKSNLMVTGGFCVDVMSLPDSQGVRLMSLFRGSVIRVTERRPSDRGWVRVGLADGREGYIRDEYLWNKEFSQAGVFSGKLPQKAAAEQIFRSRVVEYALSYLGTQYRWGGRSAGGIDCSGYTSACYMLCGILIYRDAKIAEGYPVHEISKEEIKRGDLLYFPGHIALYVENGRYLHSTGKAGSSGVRMNSLISGDSGYRRDLAESLYAAGSIF